MINFSVVAEGAPFIGRRIIKTQEAEITADNILDVLAKAMQVHEMNRVEIQYLWDYYRGKQPILNRVKQVRPEINNRIVENRANEIVDFKSGYLMGEPVQYVSRGGGEELTEEINRLNEYVFEEEKESLDLELADWFHICGTSYRMVLPDRYAGEEDDSPFELYTLDPRNTFVVYYNGLGERPVLGVTYVLDENNLPHYFCYTKSEYFEILQTNTDGVQILAHSQHIVGDIPIVEYPLNSARLGAFEIVLGLLDAINLTESNREDGVEQFIQALMVFYNVDLTSEKFQELKEKGALCVSDADPQIKAKVEYLVNNLSQAETQTLTNQMYQAVLTICGMPNRNGGSSTSDTGAAVVLRDGWSDAEARAQKTEKMFKKSERRMLKMMLNICRITRGLDLKVGNIEIRFTRRNYENIGQKAQVLDLLLKNEKVHPQLAFAHCGLFVDSELAYTMSMEYYEEQQRALMEGETEDDAEDNTGDGAADGGTTQAREPSGVTD